MKKLLSMLALFMISLMTISMVSATSLDDNLEIVDVDVNGEDAQIYTASEVDNIADVDHLNGIAVDEGEVLEIEVDLEATATAEDVQIEAEIRGYEYDDYEDLDDRTETFNMRVNGDGTTTRSKNLEITLPNKLEDDRYLLRLSVDDKDSGSLVRYIVLQVEPSEHGIEIADVSFSPGNTVKAGRSLLTTVLLENYGYEDEDDVKVTVSVPELGISATEYVDVVETDSHNVDYEDVPEMFLPIPATAAEGEYQVKVTAKYDHFETVTKTYTINVVANELFQEQTLVLAYAPENQNVATGKTAIYALELDNAGTQSKAYVLEAAAGDWATASVSESLVVLRPGESKVVSVSLSVANDAVVGEHLASVVLKSGSEDLQTVVLKANVLAGDNSGSSLRNGLEIALIVLVVLLVIIGLIIGFSRLRKDDEDDDQAYY